MFIHLRVARNEELEEENPRTLYRCKECKCEICAGDGAYDIDGDVWCPDCIENAFFTAEG